LAVRGQPLTPLPEGAVHIEKSFHYSGDLPRPRILVIANPYGGAKQAKPRYYKFVKPIFDAAFLEHEVVCMLFTIPHKFIFLVTAQKDHAKDIFAGKSLHLLPGPSQPITSYDGFACISGDGLINECLQVCL